jgi:outer membrane protein TolC
VDASREALQAERANAQLGGQRLIAAIQFIKALGGGWRDQQLFADAKPNPAAQTSTSKSE